MAASNLLKTTVTNRKSHFVNLATKLVSATASAYSIETIFESDSKLN